MKKIILLLLFIAFLLTLTSCTDDTEDLSKELDELELKLAKTKLELAQTNSEIFEVESSIKELERSDLFKVKEEKTYDEELYDFSFDKATDYIGLSVQDIVNIFGVNHELHHLHCEGPYLGVDYSELGVVFAFQNPYKDLTGNEVIEEIHLDNNAAYNGVDLNMSLTEIEKVLGNGWKFYMNCEDENNEIWEAFEQDGSHIVVATDGLPGKVRNIFIVSDFNSYYGQREKVKWER